MVLARKYPDKGEADAVPLAFRIIRLKIMEHRRRQANRGERRTVSVDDIQLKSPQGSSNPEELVSLQEAVYGALDQLGRKCRKLLLWQLEGLSGDEIARPAESFHAQCSVHRDQPLQEEIQASLQRVAQATGAGGVKE